MRVIAPGGVRAAAKPDHEKDDSGQAGAETSNMPVPYNSNARQLAVLHKVSVLMAHC